jgi:hypothetical protein
MNLRKESTRTTEGNKEKRKSALCRGAAEAEGLLPNRHLSRGKAFHCSVLIKIPDVWHFVRM